MVKIGVIGDFDGRPSHVATNLALRHSADHHHCDISVHWVPTETLYLDADALDPFDAVFGSPGSPYKNLEGALRGIRFARENRTPFLGTCGGFQHAVIEYAQNVLGLRAEHAEVDPNSKTAMVAALSCDLSGAESTIILTKDSKCSLILGSRNTLEKFRCSYGLNPVFQDHFREGQFRISGTDIDGNAIVLELINHPFFVATLFQPQLSSSPEQPHPLIDAFLKAARADRNANHSLQSIR